MVHQIVYSELLVPGTCNSLTNQSAITHTFALLTCSLFFNLSHCKRGIVTTTECLLFQIQMSEQNTLLCGEDGTTPICLYSGMQPCVVQCI